MTVPTTDIVVIGAGAMGSGAARALATAGRDVVVLDKYGLGHQLGGSHGRTRLFRMAVDDEGELRRAQQARRLWAEVEQEAGEQLIVPTGGLDHGVGDEVAIGFSDLFAANGLAHEVLDPQEAAERWPGMRFRSKVLFQAGAGRILADRALAALQRSAVAAGAEFRPECPVTGIRVLATGDGVSDGLVQVQTDSGELRCKQLVVTAGPWAPALLEGIVAVPRIVTTQEQPRLFAPLDDATDWPSFVHWRTHDDGSEAAEAYGLFEPDGGVKIGLHATGPRIDPDVRDFRPEPAADRELLDYVTQWYPGVDPAVSTPISCLYDNTGSGNFVIDRVGPVSVATGFCGQGFKFVPLVARYLTDLVRGDGAAPAMFRLAAHPGP